MKQSRIQQKIEALRNVTLRQKERSAIRAHLARHITEQPVSSPYVFRSWISIEKITSGVLVRTMVMVLAVIGIVGGTVSFAAAGALPGEILYGIKLSNEQLQEKFAFSLEKKAELQQVHVENRLREVRTLIQDESLDPRRKEIIEEKLGKNISELSKTISTMQNAGAVIEISSELGPTLEAHRKIFAVLAATSDEGENTRSLLSRVEDGITHMRAETEQAIENFNDDAAIEILAEKYLEKADITLSTMLLVLEARDLFSVPEDIDLAQAVHAEYNLREAEIAFAAEEYKSALKYARIAHNEAKEIISKLELETELQVEDESANEEEKTLSEEYAQLQKLLEELDDIISQHTEKEPGEVTEEEQSTEEESNEAPEESPQEGTSSTSPSEESEATAR